MNVPPSRPINSVNNFSSSRRKVLGLLGGLSLGALTQNTRAQEETSVVTEGIKLRFDSLIQSFSSGTREAGLSKKSNTTNSRSQSVKL